MKNDQFVLSWLNATLSDKVFPTVFGLSIVLVMLGLLYPTALLLILRRVSNISHDNFEISTKVLKVAQTILHMQRTLLFNLVLLERSLRIMKSLPIWSVNLLPLLPICYIFILFQFHYKKLYNWPRIYSICYCRHASN
jgi:hypothetical protein